MTKEEAILLDDCYGISLPVPKFKIGDNILYNDGLNYYINKILGIRYSKCTNGYFIEYQTFDSILVEDEIILKLNKK